jgi:hypothetical protein
MAGPKEEPVGCQFSRYGATFQEPAENLTCSRGQNARNGRLSSVMGWPMDQSGTEPVAAGLRKRACSVAVTNQHASAHVNPMAHPARTSVG